MFKDLQTAVDHLVTANRILANEGVVDAYGHVSVRHPLHADRFLLACSRSPELVVADDIKTYTLTGEPLDDERHQPYLERFIHASIYEARTDVHAVIHSHADAVLPFTIVRVPLVPVLASASDIGSPIPLWDIRDSFGDTDMRVSNIAQGRDFARFMGATRTALMRGHGFTTTGGSLIQAVKAAIYMPINARAQLDAMRLGEIIPLSRGEIEVRSRPAASHSVAFDRAWEYWSRRAGVSRH